MKPHFFIGIDRSDYRLDLCLLDSGGAVLEQTAISSDPEAMLAWARALQGRLPDGARVALCIEQPCPNLLHFFMQFDFLVLYLINPITLKCYREAFNTSRAKDDKKDAFHLARLVLEKHDVLKAWHPDDPETRQLALLTQKRRQLVDLRVSTTNRLTQVLKDCFPQALQLTGRDLHARLALAFLEKWPTLQALQKARPATIRKFYHLHGSRRPKPIEERLALIARAVPICIDPVILECNTEFMQALLRQLRGFDRSIRRFDALIADAVAAHQDAPLFTTLPGAGPNLAARLLAFFGSDREVYPDPASVQNHSGVAPVTKQSGKMFFVHRRYACCKFWRQTFIEWAGQTVMKSRWAKAYYHQQKQKGQRHHTILRGLAYKWIRIVHRCWQTRQPYDEDRYLAVLAKRNSPLIAIINKLAEASEPQSTTS
jgi:transposase